MQTVERTVSNDEQYVNFRVGSEQYGIDIQNVQEVIRIPSITKIPQTLKFIRGIINLRGNIIPVIDMRERFNQESLDYKETTRVIVIRLKSKLYGLIVDTVSQVVTLDNKEIAEPPEIIAGISKEYISGLGKNDDTMIIILNSDKILSDEELRRIRESENDLLHQQELH